MRILAGLAALLVMLATSITLPDDDDDNQQQEESRDMTTTIRDHRTGSEIEIGAQVRLDRNHGYGLIDLAILSMPGDELGPQALARIQPLHWDEHGDRAEHGDEKTIHVAARLMDAGAAGDGSDARYLISIVDPLGLPALPDEEIDKLLGHRTNRKPAGAAAAATLEEIPGPLVAGDATDENDEEDESTDENDEEDESND